MRTGGSGDAAPPAAGAGQSSPDGPTTPRPAGQPPGDAPRPAGARTSLARIRWLFSSVQRSEKTLLWRRNSAALTTTQQAAQRRSTSRAHRRQILSRSRFKPGMPLIAAPGLRCAGAAAWAAAAGPGEPRCAPALPSRSRRAAPAPARSRPLPGPGLPWRSPERPF